MKYYQKVNVETDFEKAVYAFNNIDFVKFLVSFQPIKIIIWEGIKNGDYAFFKLWFLGWKNFKVKHSNYRLNSEELYFTDTGLELPLNLIFWKHNHIIKKNKNKTTIEDSIQFKHSNILMEYILFPILVTPILTRKVLYKMYFTSKNYSSWKKLF